MMALLTETVLGFGVALAVFGGLFSKKGLFSGRPKFFGKYCSKSVPAIAGLFREHASVRPINAYSWFLQDIILMHKARAFQRKYTTQQVEQTAFINYRYDSRQPFALAS